MEVFQRNTSISDVRDGRRLLKADVVVLGGWLIHGDGHALTSSAG
jgi:hypothetical protein